MADGALLGKYVQGGAVTGNITIDASSLSLSTGNTLELSRSGNNLVVSFTAIPEPATMMAVGAGVLGLGAFLRRKFAK